MDKNGEPDHSLEILDRVRKEGSFQKNPFSRESREFRDSRDSRGVADSGQQCLERRIQPNSRDSRDSFSEKTSFAMTRIFRSRLEILEFLSVNQVLSQYPLVTVPFPTFDFLQDRSRLCSLRR